MLCLSFDEGLMVTTSKKILLIINTYAEMNKALLLQPIPTMFPLCSINMAECESINIQNFFF